MFQGKIQEKTQRLVRDIHEMRGKLEARIRSEQIELTKDDLIEIAAVTCIAAVAAEDALRLMYGAMSGMLLDKDGNDPR